MTHGMNWPASWGAPPLFATPRNPSLRTEGAQVGVIAKSLGTPLIPWQQYVADVAGERRPDGEYEYQIVIVTVPRQTGKTTLVRASGTHCALVNRRDVFYTAQTGKDARARWTDLVKIIRVHDALSDRVRITLRGGSESVEFPGGAVFQAFAPTPESLHGYTPPRVKIDEAFAQSASAGELLMGAIGPAQFTITDRQLWLISTMGTAESTFFHDWVDRGMAGTPRVACFYWGAADDQDPYDLRDIERFHPGVGQVLNGRRLSAQDVLDQADRHTRAEYERAYGNRRTLTLSHLIPVETWRDLALDGVAPPLDTRDVTLAYDVDPERNGAIVAVWDDPASGKPVVSVVQADLGVDWLADAVDNLDRTWRPQRIAAVDHGPVLAATAELRRRDVDVDVLPEREFAAASGSFLTGIDTRAFGHDGGELLERAATGLVTRTGAVDGVAFSRRHSVGPSAAAIAATAGLWRHQEHNAGAPVIYFHND